MEVQVFILQVQFRLKQIISADSQHKESLLRELEEFAFQGCTKSMTYDTAAAGENVRRIHVIICLYMYTYTGVCTLWM